MNAPIVFIHLGSSTYLHFSIRQAKSFNPDSTIFLISDVPPENSWSELVEFIPLSHFSKELERFEKRYVHIAHTEVVYERFCMSRWLIMRALAREKALKKLVHLDSDVLLFENVENSFKRFQDCDFTLSLGHSGHTSFWQNINALDNFCDYMMGFYNGTNDSLIKEVLDWFYRTLKSETTEYGLCDMYFLTSFVKQNPQYKIGESARILNGEIYDNNINMFNELDAFVPNLERNKKQIFWREGFPYALHEKTNEHILCKSLHFQGVGKFLLHEYFICSLESLKRKFGSKEYASHEEVCDVLSEKYR
jgi:hypothetical protein